MKWVRQHGGGWEATTPLARYSIRPFKAIGPSAYRHTLTVYVGEQRREFLLSGLKETVEKAKRHAGWIDAELAAERSNRRTTL